MDFSKYANQETGEIVGRLAAEASQKVAGDLQALREALDLVMGALDTALSNQTPVDYHEQVSALAERLTAEAARHAEAAAQEARAEAQALIDQTRASLEAQSGEHARLTAAVDEGRRDIDRLKSQLDAQIALTAAARSERTEAQEAHKRAEAAHEEALGRARRENKDLSAELTSLREQFEAARSESARLGAQRDAEAAQSEKMTAALGAVTTELQDAKAQAKKLTAEAKAAAAEMQTLKHAYDEEERTGRALQKKLDEATAALSAAEQRVKAAETAMAQAKAEAQAARQASDKSAKAIEEGEARAGRLLAQQADTIRKHAGSFVSLSFDRLLGMFSQEGGAGSTMDATLAAVVDAMAAQFPRVALFRVQSNHLEGVRQIGFDVQGDISQVLIPRNRDSLVVHAVKSGSIETQSGKKLASSSGMPFGGSPEFGLALPLVVNGECLAVVYADDSGQPDGEFAKSELREKFARLLQYQAVPLLTRLVAEAKVLAELEQYAALLLKELEQTHADEVAANTPEADRRKNLKENIEYARRMYAQRAEPEGAPAAPLFERRLFAAVETAGDTPFCRDVLAIMGGRKKAARVASGA